MPARYVSPDVESALTSDEIRRRYRDTALVIFKEHQLCQLPKIAESEQETTFLSFGISRKTMTYSNNGNEPVQIQRSKTETAVQVNEASSLPSILRISQKHQNCTIS